MVSIVMIWIWTCVVGLCYHILNRLCAKAAGVSCQSVVEHAEVCDIAQMVLLAVMGLLAVPDFSLEVLQMITADLEFHYSGVCECMWLIGDLQDCHNSSL